MDTGQCPLEAVVWCGKNNALSTQQGDSSVPGSVQVL